MTFTASREPNNGVKVVCGRSRVNNLPASQLKSAPPQKDARRGMELEPKEQMVRKYLTRYLDLEKQNVLTDKDKAMLEKLQRAWNLIWRKHHPMYVGPDVTEP